ncbi:uncharacterized protein LOC144561883 isoform X2 [Carex rostrata]
MELNLLNEIDSGGKRFSNNNLLHKLSEFGEYSKKAHCKIPLNFDPNQKRKKIKENSSPSKKLMQTGTDLAQVMYDSFRITIPADLVSIDHVIKSLKHHRRTQSINDINDFSISSPLSNSGYISRCTSERWIFDSIERPVPTKKLPKYPLNLGKFSMDSGPKSSGIIHTKWKDGLPYFEFHLRGKSGEYLVANPLKVDNLNNRGLDYIYLFHKWVSKKNGSNFVGMMEVSSSLVLNSGSCCSYVDTEFVLFSTDTRDSNFCCTKNTGFMKKAFEILRPNNPFSRTKSTRRGTFGESSVVDESSFTNFLSQEFPSNFESCATVVRSYQYKNEKEPISGGWGLNFLPKVAYSERNGENSEEKERKIGVELSVLLPSGVHGSPDTVNAGPTRLIERWRSGGLCDCGGWDLGCPITVLKNDSSISNKEDSLQVNANGSIDLSIEGNPMIRISGEKEATNVVYINKMLSALQCFSVAVAVLHQQIPDLCRKI